MWITIAIILHISLYVRAKAKAKIFLKEITTKLTGFHGAERSEIPVQRIVRALIFQDLCKSYSIISGQFPGDVEQLWLSSPFG
jgi:hypothetical protein